MVAKDQPGADNAASAVSRFKPLLTVDQQIVHLKSKGVTFDLCSEAEAAEYLAEANNYLRTAAYRKLYPIQTEGLRAGEYVNLDFGHLRALSSLDRGLREALLAACVDIEHFAKVWLLHMCEEHGENGHAVVDDFLASLNHAERSRLLGTLSFRGRAGQTHDEYSGDLIAHYEGCYPVWVLLEVVELGPFVNLVLFCAGRWGDKALRSDHYVLRSVKALRNACAHNSLIVNGFCSAGDRVDYTLERDMLAALTKAGVPNSKSRRAKLKNLRIAQISATLYSLNRFCHRESTMSRHARRFAELRDGFELARPLLESNNPLLSYFDFIWRLVDVWLPAGHNNPK